MNKLYVLLMFIALVACVACQRQQPKTQKKNAETEEQVPQQPREQQQPLKSQAQKFQPRRIVPMTSPTIETPTPTPIEKSPMKDEVPQEILGPILNEAVARANVPREQLVIVRAESVVWNDGSLGCPEPGMMYTQALVNGYWVIIDAAGQTYDFRVDRSGRFRLCPPGQGQPPSQPVAN